MAESFFTSGNQIVTTEIDVDSPVTEGLVSKIKGRDVELSDAIIPLGGGGPYSSDADANGNLTVTVNTSLYGIKHYNNLTINSGVTVTAEKVSTGPGTVSTTNNAATFSSAHGLKVGDSIRLTSGAQANETRVVTRIDSATTVTIRNAFSANQTNQNWNKVETGIPLIIFARGTVTINGTITANGAGGIGGENTDITGVLNIGESTNAGGAGGGGGGSGGANGGQSSYYGIISAGGGAGSNGSNSPVLRLCDISPNGKMGGGGGGGGILGGIGGGNDGGDGGGCVYIEAPNIVINTGASITCNGTNGGNGTATYGGGGGGGGGVIFMRYKSITNNGSLSVIGGTGGTATAGNGGNGGDGLIYNEVIP